MVILFSNPMSIKPCYHQAKHFPWPQQSRQPFFMVIGITFLDHRCHFSWLKVYYFIMTCYLKMCNTQVKRGNNTICTSIISWCSFHNVKSTNVNFQNFMVIVVFMVQIFMVCYFEATCRRFQFSMVANIIFLG